MNAQNFAQMKDSLNIVRVISRYVSLVRKGKAYVGLCPFHADKHPSLTVDPVRKLYHCFACGAGGDAITFVQQLEHCSFRDALQKLDLSTTTHTRGDGGALRGSVSGVRVRERGEAVDLFAPLPLPTVLGSGAELADVRAPFLIPPHVPAEHARFLRELLPYHVGCSELTAAYLDFEVGCAADLFRPTYHTRTLQMLRSRIIFPIRDVGGQLVGFSGRQRSDRTATAAKYINSSAADGFDKGAILYGLHRAKEAIELSGLVYLVEGYKDAIAMHAAGYRNTVALCGTAFTAGHRALLGRLATQVVLLLDGDAAGMAAAQKIVLALRSDPQTCAIYAVQHPLPQGEDPDSLFRQKGLCGFRRWMGTV